MIEEGRYCPDILTQIRAIRSALKSLESGILERHLSHCVSDAIKSGTEKERNKKLEEIKEIFKRYDET
jgi:DNA-binding FrmR family transcriptional regulator